MSDPIIANNQPAATSLEAGVEYHWCACGRRETSPSATAPTPAPTSRHRVSPPRHDGEAYLCACKRTGTRRTATAPTPSSATSRGHDGMRAPAGTGRGRHLGQRRWPRPRRKSQPWRSSTQLARDGLSKVGHHGPMTSMGVPRKDLPHWDDIQIMAAQMATKPLLDDARSARNSSSGPRPTSRSDSTSRCSCPT